MAFPERRYCPSIRAGLRGGSRDDGLGRQGQPIWLMLCGYKTNKSNARIELTLRRRGTFSRNDHQGPTTIEAAPFTVPTAKSGVRPRCATACDLPQGWDGGPPSSHVRPRLGALQARDSSGAALHHEYGSGFSW
jgi:hypothetical protein